MTNQYKILIVSMAYIVLFSLCSNPPCIPPTDPQTSNEMRSSSSGVQDGSWCSGGNGGDTIAANTRIRCISLATQRRSVRAPAARLPRLRRRRRGLATDELGLDEHRNDGASG